MMREMAAMTPGGTRVLAVEAPVCDAAVALDNHQNQNIFDQAFIPSVDSRMRRSDLLT